MLLDWRLVATLCCIKAAPKIVFSELLCYLTKPYSSLLNKPTRRRRTRQTQSKNFLTRLHKDAFILLMNTQRLYSRLFIKENCWILIATLVHRFCIFCIFCLDIKVFPFRLRIGKQFHWLLWLWSFGGTRSKYPASFMSWQHSIGIQINILIFRAA